MTRQKRGAGCIHRCKSTCQWAVGSEGRTVGKPGSSCASHRPHLAPEAGLVGATCALPQAHAARRRQPQRHERVGRCEAHKVGAHHQLVVDAAVCAVAQAAANHPCGAAGHKDHGLRGPQAEDTKPPGVPPQAPGGGRRHSGARQKGVWERRRRGRDALSCAASRRIGSCPAAVLCCCRAAAHTYIHMNGTPQPPCNPRVRTGLRSRALQKALARWTRSSSRPPTTAAGQAAGNQRSEQASSPESGGQGPQAGTGAARVPGCQRTLLHCLCGVRKGTERMGWVRMASLCCCLRRSMGGRAAGETASRLARLHGAHLQRKAPRACRAPERVQCGLGSIQQEHG